MRTYRNSIGKRICSLLLSLLLIIGMVPVSVFAEEGGSFILVAEGGGGLAIAPTYVNYTAGQTVGEALECSGYEFVGLGMNSTVTEINGVVGNYYRGDQDGGYDFTSPASSVTFYRFHETEDSAFSEGLKILMTVMADYQKKDSDVQAAAKDAYDKACEEFVGIDDASAKTLAEDLETAISNYEAIQNADPEVVMFKDGTASLQDAVITAENLYGKVWTDEDQDGTMYLPKGTYAFHVEKDGVHVDGQLEVTGSLLVEVEMPKELWLNQEIFKLSGSFNNGKESSFEDDLFTLGEWSGRSVDVAVKDTFTGSIYTYANYIDSAKLSEEEPKLTAIYPSAKTEEQQEKELIFDSYVTGMSHVLKKGAEGNSVTYRISSKGDDGYTYAQDYTVNFHRIPTLQGITVKDAEGTDQAATEAFDSDKQAYTYKVLSTVEQVTVDATPLKEEYQVKINGEKTVGDVVIPLEENTTNVDLEVSYGDFSNTYSLTIERGAGKQINFVTNSLDVTMRVENSNGQVMPYSKYREGADSHRYQYTLIPGETYSYVATRDTYYHIANEFTVEESAGSTIDVDVSVENWLTDLAFGYGGYGKKFKNTLALDQTFASDIHEYKVKFIDFEHLPYIWADGDSDADMKVFYQQVDSVDRYHGKTKSIAIEAGNLLGEKMSKFLMANNPTENTATIRLTKEIDGITHYQDYVVDFDRKLTLENISAKCEGVTTTLVQKDGTAGYTAAVNAYDIKVSMAARTLDLNLQAYTENRCAGETEPGYRIKVDGVDVTETGTASISLDGTLDTQVVSVLVESEKAPAGSTEYVLYILKSPPVEAIFETTPENTLIAMYETMSNERLWPNEDGAFQLCEGYSYRYAATAYGYVGRAGVLEVTRDEAENLVVKDGEELHMETASASGGGELSITWDLEQAEINDQIRLDMTSEWDSFRGDATNNAVTDAAVPNAAEDGTLYWANKIGEGYSSNAVGSPILVDGDLITYAGNKIFRVDTITGEIKTTGTMDHKSAHATTPPSYAEGMVFVALTDGTVQAFNADTLESLWIYKDPLGGQPVCPLTIHDGYLYTGFWNNETADANFVCLSITDENPKAEQEEKNASWYYTVEGGYYWAGAYVCDDFVMIGTDDGTSYCDSDTSCMLLFDPATGRLLDRWDGLNGDIRSTVVYDETTDAYYFTSKGGTFYSVQVIEGSDGWEFGTSWSVKLENGYDKSTPMSTSSPIVYQGRAYVGVSGAGQFAAYSGHNITVIDLTSRSIAYRAETQGYPQTSGLLSTAYEAESGYVYIYFFDNMTPGKLRVLRDKAGQKSADYVTTENGKNMAYELFTPTGDQAQYAICSPIVDEYGTVYFKNDSAHMMAFGSAIKKIEVTKNPAKMIYHDGETFNPDGMVVTATYANGKTRDITNYVTYDLTKVTEKDHTVTIAFPHVKYHNAENGTAMDTGVSTTTPVTTLTLAIGEVTAGDVNFDGEVDTIDAGLVISYYYEDVTLTDDQISLADVNGDGTVDTNDAGLIVSYFYGNVTSLGDSIR